MTETWKPVPDFPDYQISSTGRVVRNDGHEPKQRESWNGYLRVRIGRSHETRKEVHVNRLMLRAFVGEPPSSEHQAAHRDGRNQNNRIENLYWATPKENADDREKHGYAVRGENHGEAKLTNAQALEIFDLTTHKIFPQKKIAELYGVTAGLVSQIKIGWSWSSVTGKYHPKNVQATATNSERQ